MTPTSVRLYWETLRHLRPVQFYGRIWLRIVNSKADSRPAPAQRKNKGSWVQPARREQSQIGPDEFFLLNEVHSLSQHSWDDPALAKLWRYNLHYFDDLNAKGSTTRVEWHKALIARWIVENSPTKGSGWEPYPTSLRIVNWIKWALVGNSLTPDMVHSLAIQVRWLTQRLEYHLLGNHLFTNAKALVFAGCFFEGPEAAAWLHKGMRILAREVPEQILSDGGHFELSPMYHALALEDMLDLVNVIRSTGLPMPKLWDEKIVTMRDWLASMCHPDGEIAFFNDAAMGIAPSPDELEHYAIRLGLAPKGALPAGCTWQNDSGYIRIQQGCVVALLDVAKIGPDYLPGHAHADTLSFELSVAGQRTIVNSGTSVYGDGLERLRQRGTAAHNTVVVDAENSSEVWSAFRVARRARPKPPLIEKNEQGWDVSCAHDGYRRLVGKPVHHRAWKFKVGSLIVSDRIEGSDSHAEAMFHFHPDLSLSLLEDGCSGNLAMDGNVLLRWRIHKGTARLERSTWHPEFGISHPSQRLVIQLCNTESIIEFFWPNT